MDNPTSREARERILERIRTARAGHPYSEPLPGTDFSKSVYQDEIPDPLQTFCIELEKVSGSAKVFDRLEDLTAFLGDLIRNKAWPFVYVADPEWQNILQEAGLPVQFDAEAFGEMPAGLTTCEALIARFGSVVLTSAQTGGRTLNVFPPTHIVVARTSQIYPELQDFLSLPRWKNDQNELPSLMSIVTGPSRTADIEKTLILGAHGPRELIVLLLNNQTHG